MRWGYIRGAGGTPVPLELPVDTYCHALLCGSSGSGKSFSLLYLAGNILQSNPDTVITFCDFKNSEDFEFLKGYPNYYSGDDCYHGILNYYQDFSNARIKGRNKIRHLLIIDEYPALVTYLATKDKLDKTKKANEILSAVAEILMVGRGISFGIWVITQRPDASMFSNGVRLNFMVTCALGHLDKETKSMIGAADIPDKVYKKGEGIILSDSNPAYEIKFPRIRNIVDWKKHIKQELMNHFNK